MAKDQFSFDIVSEVDMQEVRNAVDQTGREISQRFDFKNTNTTVHLADEKIELHSSTEDRLKAALEVFKEKAVRREVSLKAVHFGPVLPAAKGTYKQVLNVNVGISTDKARELVKFIKGTHVKVQSQIQDDQVRVSGKNKDDLQAVIRAIKEHDFGIALQFVNFRP